MTAYTSMCAVSYEGTHRAPTPRARVTPIARARGEVRVARVASRRPRARIRSIVLSSSVRARASRARRVAWDGSDAGAVVVGADAAAWRCPTDRWMDGWMEGLTDSFVRSSAQRPRGDEIKKNPHIISPCC